MEQERRVWGKFEVLYEDAYAKLKYLYIEPGKHISYQYHDHRAEIWTIVRGCGKLILDGEVRLVAPGDTVRIEVGQLHLIQNVGAELLVIHEIQTGSVLREDDIVRTATPEELL